MESLRVHLEALQEQLAITSEWKRLPLKPLLEQLEKQVEEAFPAEDEKKISARCHKRVRKLGNALRCGWELELLGSDGSAGEEPQEVDCRALLERLDTLGPDKQRKYGRIRAGERRRTVPVGQDGQEMDALTRKKYGEAVSSMGATAWHRQAMAHVAEVLRNASASRVLDIGSSFNPLRDEFPEVTAVDMVPTHPSVLEADFLTVELADGLEAVRVDPTSPGRCLALPVGLYDAAVLSIVLRAMRAPEDRRTMLGRAASTLREGGLLVIVEKASLGALLRVQGLRDARWRAWGLQFRAAQTGARGVTVSVFERVGTSKGGAVAVPAAAVGSCGHGASGGDAAAGGRQSASGRAC